MHSTATSERQALTGSQSGSILVVALVILVIAGSVSAGVAHLVSSSASVSANTLQSEQAFYIAESAARMASCPTSEQSLGNGFFTCDESQCGDDRKLIRAGVGGSDLGSSQAFHQLCVPIDLNPPFNPDDCTHPDEVDNWSDPPDCVASGAGGEAGVIPPGQVKKTGQLAIYGDIAFQGTGSTLDFSEAQVCITGEVRAEHGGSENPTTLTIKLSTDSNSCYCTKHADITLIDEDDNEITHEDEDGLQECCSPTQASCSAFQPKRADWSYSS